MAKLLKSPDYIFEASWEVCNKVGGIYAVLSTRAKTLQDMLQDHVIFIGPDCWGDKDCPFFEQDDSLLASWRQVAAREGLFIRVGRWKVPGKPIAILVDFKPFYQMKDHIYTRLWELYQVDSLHAYGDYDEASMFSYAAGKVVESFYKHEIPCTKKVIFHGNEWMCGLGLLYIHHAIPQIATIFTTHATSIGRSIAGNNKPLYDYLSGYNGDQMAQELNMQSKHSIEKQTAKYVDCFTTVSEITNRECAQLLEKPADVVLPNGFENDFVPQGAIFARKRREARRTLIHIANALIGTRYTEKDDILIASISGRYEFRNKGIDVFIDAMNRLRTDENLKKDVLAFIEVPGWVSGPRGDLQRRLKRDGNYRNALQQPEITHWLHNMDQDQVLGMMRSIGFDNTQAGHVKLIFIPCYLLGDDGIVNKPYFDVILGNDLCIYPSYYEPWGYTPLEAVAFKVPCITTDLAGFGLWVNSECGHYSEILEGVKVIHRTDSNYNEVADAIKTTVEEFAAFDEKRVKAARHHAEMISRKAFWGKFIKNYLRAYDFALRRMEERLKEI